MIYTKQGIFSANSNEREKRIKIKIEKYFSDNPEALPYSDLIQFEMIGKSVSCNDGMLPKDIANLIRGRDGRKPVK